jgi:hypothetical protein
MALSFICTALSRIVMISAFCLSLLRSRRLGQSMLATVETQVARNSRGVGGVSRLRGRMAVVHWR